MRKWIDHVLWDEGEEEFFKYFLFTKNGKIRQKGKNVSAKNCIIDR